MQLKVFLFMPIIGGRRRRGGGRGRRRGGRRGGGRGGGRRRINSAQVCYAWTLLKRVLGWNLTSRMRCFNSETQPFCSKSTSLFLIWNMYRHGASGPWRSTLTEKSPKKMKAITSTYLSQYEMQDTIWSQESCVGTLKSESQMFQRK